MKIEATTGVSLGQVASMARELTEAKAEYDAVEAAVVAQINSLHAQAEAARVALAAELNRIATRIADSTERLEKSAFRLQKAQELRRQYG